jgi:hypothetical protein
MNKPIEKNNYTFIQGYKKLYIYTTLVKIQILKKNL